MAQKVKWKLQKTYYGWRGELTLPPMIFRGKPAAIRVKAGARTRAGAIAKAAGIASQIADSPLLQAALPPGSAIAVKAISKLARAALKGKAGKVLKKLVGKGAKRLIKSLKFW